MAWRIRCSFRRLQFPRLPLIAWPALAAAFAILLATDEWTRRACDATAGTLCLNQLGFFLTYLVGLPLLIGIPLLLAIIGGAKGRRAAVAVILALVLQALVVELLRDLAGRARPMVSDGLTAFAGPFSGLEGHDSMPSGHTATVFALAVVLGAYFPRCKPALLGAATAILLARIQVRAHFLADVFAGGFIGLCVGQFTFLNLPPSRAQDDDETTAKAVSRPPTGEESESDDAERTEHASDTAS